MSWLTVANVKMSAGDYRLGTEEKRNVTMSVSRKGKKSSEDLKAKLALETSERRGTE